jgi:Ca-activated chloride channel family protein
MRRILPIVLAATVLLAGCSASSSHSNDKAQQAPPAAGGAGGPGVVGGNGAAAPQDVDGLRAPDKRTRPADGQFGPVVNAAEDPRSTFALDVDTASYTYARTLLQSGQAPAPRTVRPEEFINAFRQDYPQPVGNGFAVALDGAGLPAGHELDGAGDLRLLRVGLRTRVDDRERPDATLTIVVDVSGSMADPGKLDLVKGALDHLIDTLRPTDAVALVTFNTRATVLLSSTEARRRDALHTAVDKLRADGGTNLGTGLVTGYDVAREGFRPGTTNRVVLLSDGLANRGDTEAGEILAKVKENAAKQITLLGVGVGRDYGDTLMEQLADRGDGFVIYVSDETRAEGVFADQLPATLTLRALDAKAQVTFNPATVDSYRLIGYDNRALADSSFRNDKVDGGEVAAGHTVTALYAVRLRPRATGLVATADVRWLDPATRIAAEATDTVYVSDLAVAFTDASPRLQLCYAAGYLAEVLRGSPYGREVALADLARIASTAAERADDPAAADLATMISLADRHR